MNSVFLKTFFSNLKQNKIKYCVLRNYEQLPQSLNGSDLDILVAGNDLKEFYEILDNTLCTCNGKIIIKYGNLTPRICVAGINENKPYGLQLDIHENILPYKTSHMFPSDFVFSRVRNYNDILVVNDDDANIVAFFKEIFNNNRVKEEYYILAQESWKRNSNLYRQSLQNIYNIVFLDRLNDLFLKDYDAQEIEFIASAGRSLLSKGLVRKYKNIKSRVNSLYRFMNPPGIKIAILGVDGAGKTTVINKLIPPLNEAVHNALFYEHMRPNLLPNIAQLLGRAKQVGPVTNPHASAQATFFGSWIRLIYYSMDYIVGYFVKIYPAIVKKSSIWIFDRYFYDYFIDQKRLRINLPLWSIKFVNIFIPEPDIILCLGTDAKIIYDRKPELPLNEITKQVQSLKNFCRSNMKAHWIDTGTDIDKSVNKSFEVIIKSMALRYRDE